MMPTNFSLMYNTMNISYHIHENKFSRNSIYLVMSKSCSN